jgi:2-polyprenyl-3-methyl-5-hydroxy-6-metoxy-1,4-benzoquinol methylase
MHQPPQKSSVPDLSVSTNYEYEVFRSGNNALAYALELTGSNKRVLEVGAGSGMMTNQLVHWKNCDVVALEINPESVEKLRSFVDRAYLADLNKEGWTDAIAGEGKFDSVLAADVLEHLYDPWAAIRTMKSLLTDEGSIVISLPHAGHSAIIACLFEENFEYRDMGLLDKTHIRFFGLHNIQALHANAGLAIVDARFVVYQPEITEFAERWRQVPKYVKSALSRHRHGNVYQVVTKAVPIERAGARSINLFDLPVQLPGAKPKTFLEKMKSSLGLANAR